MIERGQIVKDGYLRCVEFKAINSGFPVQQRYFRSAAVGDRLGHCAKDMLKDTALEQFQCAWAGGNFGCSPEANLVRWLE